MLTKTLYGNYKITELGEVISLRRNRPLSLDVSLDGYRRVSMSVNGERVRWSLHRLVATTFIPNPENKPCVNHIDGDKSNNAVSNLEWCTYSENELHSYRVLGKQPPKTAFKKGCKQDFLRTKIAQYTKCGELVKVWDCQQDASRAGFNQPNINSALKGKRKSADGYIWKYNEE